MWNNNEGGENGTDCFSRGNNCSFWFVAGVRARNKENSLCNFKQLYHAEINLSTYRTAAILSNTHMA